MSDTPVLAISLSPRGMNSSLDPTLLEPGQVAKIVNGQLDRQTITTRFGTRVMPVSGDWDRAAAVQGAVFYDPKRGAGAQVFSDDSASIFLATGGRKRRFFIGDTTAKSEDVTGDAPQDDVAKLIWMAQAENYLISGDGKKSTYIFDGENASYSTGFIGSGDDRDDSSIPQGITVPVYAHGRLWVVVDSRRILASDSLHGSALTASEDLLKFVEQVYWAEGQFFVPPSSMGNIIAAAILPTRDTSTGQGEIMFHCINGGIFSIRGNIFPRGSWSDSPMVNHFVLDTAATGPYALDIQESDQLFRSRVGIQTLSSARGESRLIGRPMKPISEEVGNWLDLDYVPYLRYVSLINWSQQERLFCSVAPQVVGRHTYSKGLVSLNWDPTDSQQHSPAWEGLWTFPCPIKYVSNMVRAQFRETERAFGFHYDGSQYSLVEYDPKLKCDVLEDGTEIPIEMIVESREVTGPNPYDKIGIASGSLHLKEISKTTTWKVDIRSDQSQCWVKWRDGSVCIEECPDPATLVKQQPQNLEVELGKPPGDLFRARRWQFRVTVTGWARLEGLIARIEKLSDDNDFAEERLNTSCKQTPVCCDDIQADFAYSEVACPTAADEAAEEAVTSTVTAAVPSAPGPVPVPPYVPPVVPPIPPTPAVPGTIISDSLFLGDLTAGTMKTLVSRVFRINSYMEISDAAQTGLDLDGFPDMTLNVWCQGIGMFSDATFMSKGTPTGNQGGYNFYWTNTKLLHFEWSNDGSTINTEVIAAPLATAFGMFSVVFAGTSLKMYHNGVEVHSATVVPSIFNNTAPFQLGNGPVAGTNGGVSMEMAGVWSRNLSAVELLSLYNSGTQVPLVDMTAGEQIDLVSFYHLNELAPNDAIDAVGSNDLADSGSATTQNDYLNVLHACTEGSSFTQWDNLSTNGAPYSNAIAPADFPEWVNGKPTWRQPVERLLSLNPGAAFAQPFTLIVIATASANAANLTMITGSSAGESLIRTSAAGTQWAIDATSEVAGGTADLARHVFIGYFDGASSYLRVDGVVVATGDPGANSMDDLLIGTNRSQADDWLGTIELSCLVPRVLTASELTDMEAL